MKIINCTAKDITIVTSYRQPIVTYHKSDIEITKNKNTKLVLSPVATGLLNGIPVIPASIGPCGPVYKSGVYYIVDKELLAIYNRSDFLAVTSDGQSFICIE